MINDNPMDMDDYYPVPKSQREKKKSVYVEPPRPKRGDLKPMDSFEQHIRDNAVYYTVTLFQHVSSTRAYNNYNSLEEAKDFAVAAMRDDTPYKAAMVYAVDSDGHFALECTRRRGEERFKYPVIKRY